MSRSERVDADSAADAVAAFARGEPVLIHDAADREGETDIVYPAGSVTPSAIARLRNDAGGLVCVALSDSVAAALELPFMQEVLDHPTAAAHDLAYDERSSFSLTVNHRDTFTGITDEDRSLTIRELAGLAADPDADAFAASFRSLARRRPGVRGRTRLPLRRGAVARRRAAVTAQ